MPRFIVFLTALFTASTCFAELTAKDLPLIEGTPLEYLDASNANWTVLDYQENDAGLLWVWLQRESQQAYLTYPSESADETFTFPDDTTVSVVSDRVNMTFIASDTQQIDLTRFGGKVTLDGQTISVSYTLEKFTDLSNGSFYATLSETGLDLDFDSKASASDDSSNPKGHATINTTGAILTIAGPRNGTNTLESRTGSDTIWTLGGPNTGRLSLGSRTPGNFISISNLVGGTGNDTFDLSTIGSALTGSIEGRGGIDTLVPPKSESYSIATPSNSCNNVNGSQSSATISSGTFTDIALPPSSNIVFCPPGGSLIDSGDSFIIGDWTPTILELSQTTDTATPKRKHKSWAGFADCSTFFLLLLAPFFYRKSH